ncbi:MAG: hypothetical protein AAGB25_06825 [Pseudomonadota bacterium]
MRKAAVGLTCLVLASAAGCATVSVYETVSVTEIQLSEPQSDLHKASEAYCELANDEGWAEGESNWSKLRSLLGGEAQDEGAYWRRIGADELAPSSVLARVEADAGKATDGLVRVNDFAKALIASGESIPEKADIVQFERALIHAKQARESFSIALSKAKTRASENVPIDAVLVEFDAALEAATQTADDLAEARMADVVAGVPTATT